MKTALLSVLVMAASVAFAAEPGTVKIAHFKEVISPEVGAKICGYDADQVSVTKHDGAATCSLRNRFSSHWLSSFQESVFVNLRLDAAGEIWLIWPKVLLRSFGEIVFSLAANAWICARCRD